MLVKAKDLETGDIIVMSGEGFEILRWFPTGEDWCTFRAKRMSDGRRFTFEFDNDDPIRVTMTT